MASSRVRTLHIYRIADSRAQGDQVLRKGISLGFVVFICAWPSLCGVRGVIIALPFCMLLPRVRQVGARRDALTDCLPYMCKEKLKASR